MSQNDYSEILSRVRLLNQMDKEMFLGFIQDRMTVMKSNQLETRHFLELLDQYLGDNQRCLLWGAFDTDGNLLSTMGMAFWTVMPYVTLSYMFTRKTDGPFNAGKNGLIYCLHKCLEYGEGHGIKAYYSLQKTRDAKHKEKTWRKYDTPITTKYYSVLELIIPANQETKHGIVWEIMDKKTWPYETDLWVTRLKPEFEEVINWGASDE